MMMLLFLISFIVSIFGDLSIHNQARRQAGVYPMFKWDYGLVQSSKKVAQWLCNTGKWQHSSKGSCSTCRPYGTGENLAGHGNLPAASKAWLAEKQYWSGGRCRSGKMCGHYTQMISRNAANLGCYAAKCPGGGMAGRTICHYTAGSRLVVDEDCDDGHDDDMCLYADGEDEEAMRFAVSQNNGCDFEDKVYKHTDVAFNNYYLHYVYADESGNETETAQWLVSRDYVNDVALFWCDSSSLMQCEHGKWTKNVFDEIGAYSEIDAEITIKKCTSNDAVSEEKKANAASAVIIPIVIILVVLVIVGASLYLFTRYKRNNASKHMEVIEDQEEEEEEEEAQITVPVITN